jgi:hypothetical protein
MRRSDLAVLDLVETEDDFRSLDHDRPFDEVRALHHHVDRLLFRPRQPALLEDRAAGADELEEAIGIDVLLEKVPGRRVTVDVDLVDVGATLLQKTSGVFAGGSGGLPVEGWFHWRFQISDLRLKIED